MAILVQSNKKPSVSFLEQTGSIVTFNSQYAGLPLKSCVVNFNDQTGIDSLDFSATGKNLLISSTVRHDAYISNTTGEEIAYNYWSATGFLPMKTGVRYRLLRLIDGNYSITAGNSIYWACYDSEYNYLSGGIGDGIMSNYNNVAYMRISSYTNLLFYKAIIVANENKDYFVTESDYIDGNGKIFNFGKTIQNGSLNVLTGELTNNDTTPPEVINLGGMNISALQGENNIWADTGETTLQYIKLG